MLLPRDPDRSAHTLRMSLLQKTGIDMPVIIKVLRSLKGLSQRQLAQRLGVSSTSWHRYETGQRPITPQLIARVQSPLDKEDIPTLPAR